MTPEGRPTVHGAAFSVYVQAVRIALEEKGVAHDLDPMNAFDTPLSERHLSLHPFGKMPALTCGDTRIYETRAIFTWIEQTCPEPTLRPTRHALPVEQCLAILDSYAYPHWVWGLYMGQKRGFDQAETQSHLDVSRTVATELSKNMKGAPFLARTESPTFADCLAAPMANCLSVTPEGKSLLAPDTELGAWWARISARPAVQRYLD